MTTTNSSYLSRRSPLTTMIYLFLAAIITLTSCEKEELPESTSFENEQPFLENEQPLQDGLTSRADIGDLNLFESIKVDNNCDVSRGQLPFDATKLNYVESRQNNTSLNYTYIYSQTDVSNFLSVDVSTSLEGEKNFGFGKASLKAEISSKITRSMNSNSKKMFVVLEGNTSNIKRAINFSNSEYSWKADAVEKLYLSPTDFTRKYGQGFAAAIYKGASFYVIYEMDYTNSEYSNSNELNAAIGVSAQATGGGSINAESSVSVNTLNTLQQKNVKITINANADNGFSAVQYNDPKKLDELITDFNNHTNGTAFDDLKTVGYDFASFSDVASDEINSDREDYLDNTHEIAMNCLNFQNEIIKRENYINTLESFYDRYSKSLERGTINSAINGLERDIQKLEENTMIDTEATDLVEPIDRTYAYWVRSFENEMIPNELLNIYTVITNKSTDEVLARVVNAGATGMRSYDGHPNNEWAINNITKRSGSNIARYEFQNKREPDQLLIKNGNLAHCISAQNASDYDKTWRIATTDDGAFEIKSATKVAQGSSSPYLKANSNGSVGFDRAGSRATWTIQKEYK